MKVRFTSDGWDSFLGWTGLQPRTANPDGEMTVLRLIEDVRRHPFQGLGKPEPLKRSLQGWWSRRITREHRLIYRVAGRDDEQHVEIMACRGHY